MKLIKNLILSSFIVAVCTMLIWISNAGFNPIWQGNEFPYNDWSERIESSEDPYKIDYWEMIKDNAVENDGLLKSLLAVFKLDNERYTGPKKALAYAIFLLNYALWFVAFVALCLLIYSFYCVVVWDQKQVDKAKSYLKGIAVAIIVMWLSWLIVSLIFRLYDDIAKESNSELTLIQTFNYLA